MLQPNDTVILFLKDHLLFCESPIRFSSHYEIDIEKVSFSYQQKKASLLKEALAGFSHHLMKVKPIRIS